MKDCSDEVAQDTNGRVSACTDEPEESQEYSKGGRGRRGPRDRPGDRSGDRKAIAAAQRYTPGGIQPEIPSDFDGSFADKRNCGYLQN
jgi:hypothetical protein